MAQRLDRVAKRRPVRIRHRSLLIPVCSSRSRLPTHFAPAQEREGGTERSPSSASSISCDIRGRIQHDCRTLSATGYFTESQLKTPRLWGCDWEGPAYRESPRDVASSEQRITRRSRPHSGVCRKVSGVLLGVGPGYHDRSVQHSDSVRSTRYQGSSYWPKRDHGAPGVRSRPRVRRRSHTQ